MAILRRSVSGSQDGVEERVLCLYRADENTDMLQTRDEPLFVVEHGLLKDGFSIPGLAHIKPHNDVALHAAFRGAGLELRGFTEEFDERAREWIIKVDFTVFRTRTTISKGAIGESARAAGASLAEIADEIAEAGRVFRPFSEQIQNEILAQRRAVWERMGLPRPGLIRMDEEIRAFERSVVADNYSHAPATAPANPPAPKPAKTISPFSIGLGQRSIEV